MYSNLYCHFGQNVLAFVPFNLDWIKDSVQDSSDYSGHLKNDQGYNTQNDMAIITTKMIPQFQGISV